MTRKLIDPLAAWDALTPHQQRLVGAAAIALGLSADNASDLRRDWSWEAAQVMAAHRITDAVTEAGLKGAPDLNSLGIRMCRGCGCVDAIGCDCGCTWVAQTRCSRCRRRRTSGLRADLPEGMPAQ